MKGYIYTMYKGADPGQGWNMTDPIFDKVPTLGACMPNIRRVVNEGDFIFSISGRTENVKQYVVGGFEVAEKINALAAYNRFPENRMEKDKEGHYKGNIIIDKDGQHLDIDYHTNHEKRIENYIIGKSPIVLSKSKEVARAREETLGILSYLFNKKGESVYELIGRWRKLNEGQIKDIIDWMQKLKSN